MGVDDEWRRHFLKVAAGAKKAEKNKDYYMWPKLNTGLYQLQGSRSDFPRTGAQFFLMGDLGTLVEWGYFSSLRDD